MPLEIVHSPYRELSKPVLAFVDELDARCDNDVVTIVIPEFVVHHWWEHLLHNQSALILKGRLLFRRGRRRRRRCRTTCTGPARVDRAADRFARGATAAGSVHGDVAEGPRRLAVRQAHPGRPARWRRPSRSTSGIPKVIALAVFSSDAISSTAYATEEILFVRCSGRR